MKNARGNQVKDRVLERAVNTNTGYRGISNRPARVNNPFQASFSLLGAQVHIGSFPTLEAARLARIEFIDSLK